MPLQSVPTFASDQSSLVCLNRFTTWRSLGHVAVINLPLRDILVNGVAHIPLPPNFRFEMGDSLSETDDYLLGQLKAHLPGMRVSPQKSTTRWFLSTVSTPEKGWRFHHDLRVLMFLKDLVSRKLPFTIRVNIPEGYESTPPTVVEVSDGPYARHLVQGSYNAFTAFIIETSEHSSPMMPVENTRTVAAHDFKIEFEDSATQK